MQCFCTRRRSSWPLGPGSWLLLAAAILLVLCAGPASAQTSFDGEVAETRSLQTSVDFLGSVDRHRAGGFEWYMPKVTAGLGHGIEAGMSWSATVTDAAAEREWLPHAKWQFMNRSGVSLAAGGAWHSGSRTGGESYGVAFIGTSAALDDRESLSVSAGVYRLLNRVPDAATRTGISLGLDRTMTDRWSVGAQWVSGQNWYGYLSTGVTVAIGTHSVYGGYCIGNEPHANHGPCLSVSRVF